MMIRVRCHFSDDGGWQRAESRAQFVVCVVNVQSYLKFLLGIFVRCYYQKVKILTNFSVDTRCNFLTESNMAAIERRCGLI